MVTTKISATEWNGLPAVAVATPELELVVVTAFGPRIAHLARPGGANLLLWKPGEYTRGEWDLRGGHRVWCTRPGADENEDTYATDNAPCEVALRDDGVRVLGAENPHNRTRRGLDLHVLDAGTVRVDNLLLNTGDMLYSGGVWALTCTVPAEGTRYLVPVGDATASWDTCAMVLFREWAGHGQGGFADPQVDVRGDRIVLTPAGVENKRMVESRFGGILMSHPAEDVTFAKRIAYEYGTRHALPMGTNIAFYVGPDNFMVEMETMGPEASLLPGATRCHREVWSLRAGAIDVDAPDAREAFAAAP